MIMEKAEATKSGSRYTFHGYRCRQFVNRKRLLVVVIVLTLLATLYSCHAPDVSLSKLIPASTTYKLIHTPDHNGATRKLIPTNDVAASKLIPDADGATSKRIPSSNGATRKLKPNNDVAASKLIPDADGATSKLIPSANGATSHEQFNDYALEKTFLPSWFSNASMAELSTRLRVKQRHEAARDSPFPLLYANMSSATRNANWVVFQRHVRSSSLYDHDDPAVDGLLRDMATLSIVATEAMQKGNRLKLSVQFTDGGWAVLKTLIEDDLHRREPPRSEIAAFHLDRVLDFCRVSPTVGRRVNIRSELAANISHIKDMFVNVTEDGRACYGRTFNEPRQVCGEPDFVDVSLQHHLRDAGNQLLHSRKSPWGYKMKMCQYTHTCSGKPTSDLRHRLKKTCMEARAGFNSTARHDSRRWVLDTLDAAYFDMLIDNWDRHHFGYLTKMNSTLVIYDNGKGFHIRSQDLVLDELLYHRGGCCLMKKTTFLKFLKLYVGPQRLSDVMRESLRADPLAPVLSHDQLLLLDRRLDKIMTFIKDCVKEHGVADVILDDMYTASGL